MVADEGDPPLGGRAVDAGATQRWRLDFALNAIARHMTVVNPLARRSDSIPFR